MPRMAEVTDISKMFTFHNYFRFSPAIGIKCTAEPTLLCMDNMNNMDNYESLTYSVDGGCRRRRNIMFLPCKRPLVERFILFMFLPCKRPLVERSFIRSLLPRPRPRP